MLSWLAPLLLTGLFSAGAAVPALAPRPVQQPDGRISVTASGEPYFVGESIVFTARVEPSGQPALLYRWFVDGQPAGKGWQNSAEFTFVPRSPGEHVVHAEAGRRAPGGRRGTTLGAVRLLELASLRVSVEVRPRPVVSVTVSQTPVRINASVTFTASVSPAISGAPFYRFHVDGRPTGNWQASPTSTYVADEAGPHVVHVEVGARRSRRAELSQTVIAVLVSSGRTPFEVRPIAPPSSPIALTLALASTGLHSGEPATFAVTAVGAPRVPQYVFDPGDGTGEQVRDDGRFSFVYQRSGTFVASVRVAPGASGTGASVTVPVAAPPPTPVRLTLQLTSGAVVQGQPASFAVRADGATVVPPYVLDPGDGSPTRSQSDPTFTVTYARAGTYSAAVSLPAGSLGTGAAATVVVAPARGNGVWLVAIAGLIGLVIVLRTLPRRSTMARSDSMSGAPPTVTAVPDRAPRFEPSGPGISVEIRLVRNVGSLRFTSRVPRRDEE